MIAILASVVEQIALQEQAKPVEHRSKDGRLLEKVFLDTDGRPHGRFTRYSPDGSVESVIDFDHGTWVSM